MDNNFTEEKTIHHTSVHHGRNFKRFRKALNIEPEYMANKLSTTIETIFEIESRSKIEDDLLKNIAKSLNLPIEIFELEDDSSISFAFNNKDCEISNYVYTTIINPDISKFIKDLFEEVSNLKSELEKYKNKN